MNSLILPLLMTGLSLLIYLSDLPKFVLRDVSLEHCDVSCEWNSMIISQRKLFFPLVHQVENEFRVFTILVGKDILALEDRRVEASTAVGGEAVLNDGFDAVAEVHFCWAVVACTLR